ncbi:hypothetical protein D3C81_1673110 [compost metagenome]
MFQLKIGNILDHSKHILFCRACNELINRLSRNGTSSSGIQTQLVHLGRQRSHLHPRTGQKCPGRCLIHGAITAGGLLDHPLNEFIATKRHEREHLSFRLHRFDGLLPFIQLLTIYHKHNYTMLSRIIQVCKQLIDFMLNLTALLSR